MIENISKDRVLILDGAMGTLLQSAGLKVGEKPESLNLTRPELIEEIHERYLSAGADVIYTNTFGANSIKMPELDYRSMISAGVQCARRAVEKVGHGLVALDIGALGKLIKPMGSLTFDMAYDAFAEVINIAKDDVDLVVFETMSDLYELKAAVLAAKENSRLPIFTTMSFDENGRTFGGCPVESMVATMEGLGVDALGLNCSLAPDQLKPIVERLLAVSSLPIILKPNAGIPVMRGAMIEYDSTPEQFAKVMRKYVDMGVSIVGGCCGTDYEYIHALRSATAGMRGKVERKNITNVASGTRYVEIDRPLVIGERINPTGIKAVRQAVIDDNFAYIEKLAVEQCEAGASILDINMGVPNVDEAEAMQRAVSAVQSVVELPLQIDSSHVDALERGLRYAGGKVIVNSVNGSDRVLDSVLPLVKKYGALVIGLTVDEGGVPKTLEDRLRIARHIVARCDGYGIRRSDIIIDCLTMTVGAEQEQARLTLEAIRRVKEELGVKTTLGVSNISYGLPNRQIINKTFLIMAMQAGLDLPIVNPNAPEIMEVVRAFNLLTGADKGGAEYIAHSGNIQQSETRGVAERSLQDCIIKSLDGEAIAAVERLLGEQNGLEIIDKHVIPALNIIGDGYEKGEIYLPQLISSSETAKKVCERIKRSMPADSVVKKCRILLATVEGDVHDIGKNIVKTVLENYGYDIIDLGRDVPVQRVVEATLEWKPRIVGLSALMTTTVANMHRTIQALRASGSNVTICVGGAVLDSTVAEEIGADYYTRDPQELVKLLERLGE